MLDSVMVVTVTGAVVVVVCCVLVKYNTIILNIIRTLTPTQPIVAAAVYETKMTPPYIGCLVRDIDTR